MTPPTDAAVLGGITAESKEYFEKRSLKKGAVNWVLLMSLGIAYVISGDFSGWNYGIGYGGWFGMLIAFLVMGAMYLFMVLGLAEVLCHARSWRWLWLCPPRHGQSGWCADRVRHPD